MSLVEKLTGRSHVDKPPLMTEVGVQASSHSDVTPEPFQEPPNHTFQRAVLRALRRKESVAALYGGDPETRLMAVVTLGAIALLDRNFESTEIQRDPGSDEVRVVTKNYINRRWRTLQFAALEQIAAMGEAPEAATMLYGIVDATRLVRARLEGPVEKQKRRVKRIEAELTPRHVLCKELHISSFSFHWLPYHQSWEGGTMETFFFLSSSEEFCVVFPDGSKITLCEIDREQQKVKEMACELLGSVEHPNAVEVLLKIGAGTGRDHWFGENVIRALGQKGLGEEEADKLLTSLGERGTTRFSLAREIAERGLGAWREVLSRANENPTFSAT